MLIKFKLSVTILLLLVVETLNSQNVNEQSKISNFNEYFEKCDSLIYSPIIQGNLIEKDSNYIFDTYHNAMCQLKNNNDQKGLIYIEEFINRIQELKKSKYKSKRNQEIFKSIFGKWKSAKSEIIDSLFNLACENGYDIAIKNNNYKLASNIAKSRNNSFRSINNKDYLNWRFKEIDCLLKLNSENPVSILKVFEDEIFNGFFSQENRYAVQDTFEVLLKENYNKKEYHELLNQLEENSSIILFDSSMAILQLNVNNFAFRYLDRQISRTISQQKTYCDTSVVHIYGVYEEKIEIDCQEPKKIKPEKWIDNYLSSIRKTYLWNIDHIFKN